MLGIPVCYFFLVYSVGILGFFSGWHAVTVVGSLISTEINLE